LNIYFSNSSKNYSYTNKIRFTKIKLILLWLIADIGAVKNTIIIKTKILYI